MSFSRGANPIWFFNNLTGEPVDDTYYAFFEQNTVPYLPQTVYQDPNGITPWSYPIEFSPNAGLPDNIFGDPSQVYRIVVRQGPDDTYPLIYLIENYIFGNGSGGSSVVTDSLLTAGNAITNPQFVDTFFGTTVTIATAGAYDIAPGWQLVLTGTGTTTITQNTSPGGPTVITGNPSYYLTFTNSGWTSAVLQQRFSNNGSIFAGGAIAIAFYGFASGGNVTLPVNYVPSQGTALPIHTFTVTTGAFQQYKWAANIPTSANTQVGSAAYVDIAFTLPTSGTVSLTNVQVTGQSTPLTQAITLDPATASPGYQELSYEQMVNAEFNVYRDSLVYQPKDSILAGWNFGLNPWQSKDPASVNIAANEYTADQTIIIQQNYVAAATGNNIAVGRASVANNYGLQVTAVTATNQFAILQYVDPATVRPYWGQTMSAMVKLSLTTTHGTNTLKVKMRLIYKSNGSLPGTVSQTDPIATWTAGSDPTTYAAGWTEIIPENDPVYTVTTTPTEFSFNQFLLPASSTANMTLGVLVYTIGDMDETATADFLVINDVSLVRNDFAIATQAETFDEALRKCQFYYEKSYDIGTLLAALTTNGASIYEIPNANLQIFGLNTKFKVTKRAIPAVRFYGSNGASAGTLGSIYNQTTAAAVAVSAITFTSTTQTGFPQLAAPGTAFDEYNGQWIANARLGI